MGNASSVVSPAESHGVAPFATHRTRIAPPALTLGIAWALTAGFIGVTFVAPLVLVIFRSLGDPLYQNYLTIAQSEAIRTIMYRTIRLGLIVTVVCAALG